MKGFSGGLVIRGNNRIRSPVSCPLKKKEHLIVYSGMDVQSSACLHGETIIAKGFIIL